MHDAYDKIPTTKFDLVVSTKIVGKAAALSCNRSYDDKDDSLCRHLPT